MPEWLLKGMGAIASAITCLVILAIFLIAEMQRAIEKRKIRKAEDAAND